MRRVLSVAVLLLVACEPAPLPLDLSGDRLMVHSMLLAEREAVHVLLQRVRPLTASDPPRPDGASVEVLPVSGAQVEIVVDGETIALAEAPAGMPPCASQFPFTVPQQELIGPGCYAAALPEGVKPGATYGLRVRIGGELVAEGSARAPAPPEILSPGPGERYPVRMGFTSPEEAVPGILVRYRIGQEVAGIRTSIAFDSLFVDGARQSSANCNYDQYENVPRAVTARTDSTVFVPRSLYCYRTTPQGGQETFMPDSIFARVSLAAFDSTYLAYDAAARQESAEVTTLQAGVTRALGLFAGASAAWREVVLVPIGGVQ